MNDVEAALQPTSTKKKSGGGAAANVNKKKERRASQFTPWPGQPQREQCRRSVTEEEGERHEGSGADGEALAGSGVAGGVESVPCHNVLRVSRRW